MILTDGGMVSGRSRKPTVIRRDTNTIVIELQQDELLTAIAELARSGELGGPGYLVIEQDTISYPREIFDTPGQPGQDG